MPFNSSSVFTTDMLSNTSPATCCSDVCFVYQCMYFKVSRIDRIMISSTGASADSVFVLDLRFSNFDQLNHAARRTRERSLRGMLNLAIFAIQVRSTNCNTTTVTHTHTACPSHHHRPHRTSPFF